MENIKAENDLIFSLKKRLDHDKEAWCVNCIVTSLTDYPSLRIICEWAGIVPHLFLSACIENNEMHKDMLNKMIVQKLENDGSLQATY